jgi:predicted DNA-binding protein YlxM (UPF0122 family)
MSISSRIQDIEWELSSIDDEASDLENQIYELEAELKMYSNTSTKRSTVYDEMKAKFLKEVSEKYSLEELEQIFQFEPGKGIQLKLKK